VYVHCAIRLERGTRVNGMLQPEASGTMSSSSGGARLLDASTVAKLISPMGHAAAPVLSCRLPRTRNALDPSPFAADVGLSYPAWAAKLPLRPNTSGILSEWSSREGVLCNIRQQLPLLFPTVSCGLSVEAASTSPKRVKDPSGCSATRCSCGSLHVRN
jgi:hypothetical protein